MSPTSEGPANEPESGSTSGAGETPASMLSEVSRLRDEARSARHGYWLPLLLFGLVIAGSAPFYLEPTPSRTTGPIPAFTAIPGFSPLLGGRITAVIYWLLAIGASLYVTSRWYRTHGRRVGLKTPARGFVIAGVIAGALLLVLPALQFMPGDLGFIHGTLPLLIIAAALWVLARAERSAALAVIAAVFTGTALLASLYNIVNILYRLGWRPTGAQWRLTALPDVLLPALVLIVSGAGAYLMQRHRRAAA